MPSQAPRWSDLGVRTLSAVVLIPVALLAVWLGGVWFELAVALLAVLMAQEWVAIVHGNNSAQFALHVAGAICGAILPLEVGIGACLLAIAAVSLLSAALAAKSAHPVLMTAYMNLVLHSFRAGRRRHEVADFAMSLGQRILHREPNAPQRLAASR